MSQTVVSRIWRAFGLQPHNVETIKLSHDLAFADKVLDLIGLYLTCLNRALVLLNNERYRIYAVQGAALALLIRLGQVKCRSQYISATALRIRRTDRRRQRLA